VNDLRFVETIIEVVATTLEQDHLLPAQGTLVVGVSGGADSLCLLHILHQLCGPGRRYPAVTLHVAHLDHQLRGEISAHEANEVARIAQSWDLPCTLGTAPVKLLAAQQHRSLEDAARIARYHFLRTVAQGQPIAVAHHRDDQVETLLLHWLRGEGPAGMLGLQTRQQDIIRPLLNITRAETLAYCAHYGLQPMEDASNTDIRYLRNRIRHQLLPLLEEMNPGFRSTLLRNAEIARIDYAWLQTEVERAWPNVVLTATPTRIEIALPALQALPQSIQHHLLRRVSAQLCGGQSPLELRHFQLLDTYIAQPTSQRITTLHLPHALHAIRQRDILIFNSVSMQDKTETRAVQQQQQDFPTGEAVQLTIPGSVIVPGTTWRASAEWVPETTCQRLRSALRQHDWSQLKSLLPETPYSVYIDAATLRNTAAGDETARETLYVRTRKAGDRIQPLGMSQEKKVKDILIDRQVPYAERAHVPLFYSAAHCIWLGGLHLDHRARLTVDTQRVVHLSLTSISYTEEREHIE
jgi:tRNA(Ile)-lysidine synthetase, N-terminal domain/tRNA(Ile)-lysidine synthetase, C-terminal domain